jgi:hypothetical protein
LIVEVVAPRYIPIYLVVTSWLVQNKVKRERVREVYLDLGNRERGR